MRPAANPRSTFKFGSLPCAFALAVGVLLPGLSLAQEVDFGTGESTLADRDNTRLMGTAFDIAGNPLPDVMIWVTNDVAPANRVRSKTRKNGNYLVRGMGSLYPNRDLEGMVARARYEKKGFETVEARVAVNKNGIQRVFPILAPTGQKPEIAGVCAVLVGTITDTNGKGIKGAVVEIESDGETLATSEPTKGDGEFEVVVWGSGEEVDLVISAPKTSPKRTTVTLQKSPQPDLFLAQTFDLSMER